MRRLVLLILLLIGAIQLECFTQNNPNNILQKSTAELTNEISIIPDFVLYFRVDKSDIDPTYMNNAAVLKQINQIINEQNIFYIDSLIISAYASPEAPSFYNERLSERRAHAVKDYFRKQFPLLNPEVVHAYGYGENWDDLRRMAEEDLQLPLREEVLRIITSSNLSEDERESKLKTLEGGTVYRYIYRNYYPRLRLGASLKIMLAKTAPENLRSLVLESTIQPLTIAQDTLNTSKIVLPPSGYPFSTAPTEKKALLRHPVAFKTNLLYDAIGAINAGVEVPVGKQKHWSLLADFAYSYWQINNLYALQTIQGGVEARYWFPASEARKRKNPERDKPLRGGFVGLYAMGSTRFDVQWVDGMQGDGFWSTGVVGGYAFPIGRNWTLEASVGFGYLQSPEVRYYDHPNQGHLMFTKVIYNASLPLYIPTKLGLSLVWTIPYQQKNGKE